jgi:hypothetical protein
MISYLIGHPIGYIMESHRAGCMISYLTGHIIKYIMESHRVLLHSTPHIMDHLGIWCMISCLISHRVYNGIS